MVVAQGARVACAGVSGSFQTTVASADDVSWVVELLSQAVFEALLILVFWYIAMPFLRLQDRYIKRMRKMLTLFPPEVVMGVESFKKAVTSYISSDSNA